MDKIVKSQAALQILASLASDLDNLNADDLANVADDILEVSSVALSINLSKIAGEGEGEGEVEEVRGKPVPTYDDGIRSLIKAAANVYDTLNSLYSGNHPAKNLVADLIKILRVASTVSNLDIEKVGGTISKIKRQVEYSSDFQGEIASEAKRPIDKLISLFDEIKKNPRAFAGFTVQKSTPTKSMIRRDPAIEAVQELLAKYNLPYGAQTPDGIYGPQTHASMKKLVDKMQVSDEPFAKWFNDILKRYGSASIFESDKPTKEARAFAKALGAELMKSKSDKEPTQTKEQAPGESTSTVSPAASPAASDTQDAFFIIYPDGKSLEVMRFYSFLPYAQNFPKIMTGGQIQNTEEYKIIYRRLSAAFKYLQLTGLHPTASVETFSSGNAWSEFSKNMIEAAKNTMDSTGRKPAFNQESIDKMEAFNNWTAQLLVALKQFDETSKEDAIDVFKYMAQKVSPPYFGSEVIKDIAESNDSNLKNSFVQQLAGAKITDDEGFIIINPTEFNTKRNIILDKATSVLHMKNRSASSKLTMIKNAAPGVFTQVMQKVKGGEIPADPKVESAISTAISLLGISEDELMRIFDSVADTGVEDESSFSASIFGKDTFSKIKQMVASAGDDSAGLIRTAEIEKNWVKELAMGPWKRNILGKLAQIFDGWGRSSFTGKFVKLLNVLPVITKFVFKWGVVFGLLGGAAAGAKKVHDWWTDKEPTAEKTETKSDETGDLTRPKLDSKPGSKSKSTDIVDELIDSAFELYGRK